MNWNREFPAGAMLICITHQFDKDKGEEKGREEIECAVLIAGDAKVGAGLRAGQFQIDFIEGGNIAYVAVLEYLHPGTQADDDSATNAFTGLFENVVGRFCGVTDGEHIKQRVQFLF